MFTASGSRHRTETWRDLLAGALGRVLDAGRGAELFWEERHDLTVTLGPDLPPVVTPTSASGLALRREGVGIAFRSQPEPSDALRLLRGAAGAGPAPGADAAPPASPRDGREGGASPVDPAAPIELLDRVLAQAERACPGAALRGRWVGFEQSVVVARSGGCLASDRRRAARITLEGASGRGRAATRAVVEAVLADGDGPGRDERDRRRCDRLAERLAERLRRRLHPASLDSGEYPVVFAPGVGGVLIHEIVGHALEADTVIQGGSWLGSAAIGDDVAVQELSVLDDPRRGRARWRVDDEGMPARATPLIRNGALAGWLTDRHTSRLSGMPMTGHGRCGSFRHAVRPRMGCTFVAAGRHDPLDALEGVARGIYVRRMEAAHVDTNAGLAVFRVGDADRIVDGAIERPLSSLVLVVDGRRALLGMERVASDIGYDACIGTCLRDGQSVATTVGAPTFRLPLVTAVLRERP